MKLYDEKFTECILIIVGLILFIPSIYLFHDTRIFLNQSVGAKGEIVAVSEDYIGEDGFAYSPIVEFETRDNRKIRFESNISNSFPVDHIHEKVDVLYDPHFPEKAKINNFLNLWLMPIILGSIGLGFLLGGFGYNKLSLMCSKINRENKIS